MGYREWMGVSDEVVQWSTPLEGDRQSPEFFKAFGSISITNDILDRLFHRASVLNIRKGISYRLHGPDAPKLEAIEKS